MRPETAVRGGAPQRLRPEGLAILVSMAGTSDVAPRAAVRAYAAAVAGCPDDSVAELTRFDDGNRHAVFRVTFIDGSGSPGDLVVRVSLTGDDAERTQASREARVLEKVGGRAGPILYDFRPTSTWFATPVMCMQFLPGRQQELRSVEPAGQQRLGTVVGRLHELPVQDMADLASAADPFSYAQGRLESILARMAWVRSPLPNEVSNRLQTAAASVGESLDAWSGPDGFSADEGLALLHGDIAPGNILWGPDPVLIDWEYARIGDPADEIAYLFDQNGLDSAARDAFWVGYRQVRPGWRARRIAERVRWWEPVTLLGSALWWAERWVRRVEADTAGSADPEVPWQAGYYADGVLGRLERLDRGLTRLR